ncbi:hypothetical protein B0H16DRAFT_1523189 [Mycena metata]|uniref:Uncharacterized protein n=1 Tax=Mycena metata TaxID=1033252 RepID=A0AAD7JM35_9AGAR|nr:hypothetical protein B0H16DRAFT_1523189 [Mycena metata]
MVIRAAVITAGRGLRAFPTVVTGVAATPAFFVCIRRIDASGVRVGAVFALMPFDPASNTNERLPTLIRSVALSAAVEAAKNLSERRLNPSRNGGLLPQADGG